jgi:hypothetical protein
LSAAPPPDLILTDLDGRTDPVLFCAAGPDCLRYGYRVEPGWQIAFTAGTPVPHVLRALVAGRAPHRP